MSSPSILDPSGSSSISSTSALTGTTGNLGKRSVEVIQANDGSSKADPYGAKYCALKVVYYSLKFFAILLYIPLQVITCIPNMISYFYHRGLHSDVQKARLEALSKGFEIQLQFSSEKKKIQDWDRDKLKDICVEQMEGIGIKDIDGFLSQVWEIQGMIAKKYDADIIRKAIDRAMSTSIYQQLKTKDENPAVEFLQVLAVLDLDSDGETAFKNYGRKILGDLTGTSFTWGQLADMMDVPAGATLAYQRNSWYTTLFWAMAHPIDAVESKQADWFPLEFNGHIGNPNLRGIDFSMQIKGTQKSMRFYYGPGPTGDHLYDDGVLVYMDKLYKKGHSVHELRHNFQNMEKPSEAMRIREMVRYQERHPVSMRFLSISFDTQAMAMKGPFLHFTTAKEFMLIYAKFAMAKDGVQDSSTQILDITPVAHKHIHEKDEEDNGIFVTKDAISDDTFKKAFQCAESALTKLSQNGLSQKYWDELMGSESGKKRLGKMMQVVTHGILSLGAVYKSLEEVPSELEMQLDRDLAASRISGACKQDIDRAVIENITLRLFFRLLTSEGPLTKEEVYSIVGAVIGRAEIVEGRLIQWSRYQILSDLLHFVGTQESCQILASELKEFVGIS